MPTIFFFGPKLERGKRKEMIKSFTDAASRLIGIEKSAFVIKLRDSDLGDLGSGYAETFLEDGIK